MAEFTGAAQGTAEQHSTLPGRPGLRSLLLATALGVALAACPTDNPAGSDPGGPDASDLGRAGAGGTGPADVVASGPPPGPAKLDLLLMVDNSISMSDKQGILQLAVPDLMSRLVNPSCVDLAGNEFPPPPPGAECPDGQRRQFDPITDVHVGIISSSLGDVGANVACPPPGFRTYAPDRVDMGHLLGSVERSTAQSNAQGFLEWRADSTELADFNLQLQRMVTDVGENGCGWEASLEAWYRFLIDPMPYRELARVPCPEGTAEANCVQRATDANDAILLDDILLAQRAAFLRDDSLVAIVMVTDENDCSVRVGAETWTVLGIQDSRPMFKGSSECADDPNSKCCYSCQNEPPPGCSVDPACAADPLNPNRLTPDLDGQNLRCHQQKRRFGEDFLYPPQRYVNALTRPTLCWNADDLSSEGCAAADLRPNPLFRAGRTPSRVFLGGILGVPWQAIESSTDAQGQPPSAPNGLRFKTYEELTADGAWQQILGTPGVPWQAATDARPEVPSVPGSPPQLPQMVESPFARPGIPAGNVINGREYDTTQGAATQTGAAPRADDLQYACIFPLETPRDCALLDPNVDNCDCFRGVLNRPLCEQSPGVSPPSTTQYWAKAYPGLRELQVLRDFGAKTANSMLASICARNTADSGQPDFGYRPAMAGVIERLQRQLPKPP